MNTWVISDTHFLHEKIIDYCNRPFGSAYHMDAVMIKRWNERVKSDDLIYHLGDVGLTKEDKLAPIVKGLNGKKILILGNHDKSAQRMMEFGFDFACEQMVITHMNYRLLLSHRPVSAMDKPSGVDYVLHGHIHNSTPESRAEHKQKGEMEYIPKFNINLSVEVINYEPQNLSYVLKKKILEDKQGMRM